MVTFSIIIATSAVSLSLLYLYAKRLFFSLQSNNDHIAEGHKLYLCNTSHTRFHPCLRSFKYPLFYTGIHVSRTSNNCSNLIKLDPLGLLSLQPQDYLATSSLATTPSSLFTKLLDHLTCIGFENVAKVEYAELITTPKFLGFAFNPLSTWFLYDPQGNLLGLLLEVNNTFKEKHVYLCYPGNEIHDRHKDNLGNDRVTSKTYSIPRSFHVSPFNNRTGRYLAKICKSPSTLDIILNLIEYQQEDDTPSLQSLLFTARVHGQAYKLNSSSLLYLLLVYPLNCFLTLPRIMYQAFLLSYRDKLAVYTRPTPLSADLLNGVVDGLTIGKRDMSLLQKYTLDKVVTLWKSMGVFEEIKLVVPDSSQLPPHLYFCQVQDSASNSSTLKVENWNAFVYFFTEESNHFLALFMAVCKGDLSGSAQTLQKLATCLLKQTSTTHFTQDLLLGSSQKTCMLVPRSVKESILFFVARCAVRFEWAMFEHSGSRFVHGSDAWGLKKRCMGYIDTFSQKDSKSDQWNGVNQLLDNEGTYLSREKKRAMHFLCSLFEI